MKTDLEMIMIHEKKLDRQKRMEKDHMHALAISC